MTRTHQLTAILTRPPATRPAIPAEGYAVGTEGASAKTGMTPGGFLPVASELAKAAAEERSTRPSQLFSAVAYLGDAFERALTERIERLARDFEAANRPHAPNTAPRMKSAGDFVQSLLLHAFIFATAKRCVTVAVESLAHLRRYLDMQLGAPDKIISGRRS